MGILLASVLSAHVCHAGRPCVPCAGAGTVGTGREDAWPSPSACASCSEPRHCGVCRCLSARHSQRAAWGMRPCSELLAVCHRFSWAACHRLTVPSRSVLGPPVHVLHLFRVPFRLRRLGRDRFLGRFSLCRLACHLGRASRVLHGTVSTSTWFTGTAPAAAFPVGAEKRPFRIDFKPLLASCPCDSSSFACKRLHGAVMGLLASVMDFRLFWAVLRAFCLAVCHAGTAFSKLPIQPFSAPPLSMKHLSACFQQASQLFHRKYISGKSSPKSP